MGLDLEYREPLGLNGPHPGRDLPIAIVGSLVILLFAVPVAVLAALVPPKEIAELVNIGTPFAFLLVNIAVIWLRRTKPDMERGFRVPFVPVFPLIGAALSST